MTKKQYGDAQYSSISRLGRRLRKMREEGKINQQDMAALMNIRQSTLSLYERGVMAPSFIVLCKFAKVFNDRGVKLTFFEDIK